MSTRADYERHAHRVQTAIAILMENDPAYSAAMPKHLRVGIDMQKSDTGGLAGLLIAKGVFTAEEYMDAMVAAAKEEADAYERIVQSMLSAKNIRTG